MFGQSAEPVEPEQLDTGPVVEPETPVENIVDVVYVGKNTYQDAVYGVLNQGDKRSVDSSTADELTSRRVDDSPIFAVV